MYLHMTHEMTILLAEDNPADEALTVRALKKNAVCDRIDVARDGAEVLDCLALGSSPGAANRPVPDLILLDLNMPKIGGLELLSRIRKEERTRFIPIVVLSSSSQDSDMRESYRLGANSYIRKPVDFERFVETIGQLGKYWLSVNQVPSPAGS
jgi:CheY-like chemotaxis protein